MIGQDISTAPEDGRWILAYAPTMEEFYPTSPWFIVSRSDDGWIDEDGYIIAAERWVPLPDPQPKPVKWAKAEGHVEVTAGNLNGQTVWTVIVVKPDGQQDTDRDGFVFGSHEAAVNKTMWWAEHLGLAWRDSSKVVPFARGLSHD